MKTKPTAQTYSSTTPGGTMRIGAIVPDDMSTLGHEFYLEIECLPDRAPAAMKLLKNILTSAGYVVERAK